MVRFEKNCKDCHGLISDTVITINHCDIDDYLYIIRALLCFIGGIDKDDFNKDDLYYMSMLLQAMLPTEEQIKAE